MPSLQLGYGPMGLMRAAMDRNNSIYADDNGSSSDNQVSDLLANPTLVQSITKKRSKGLWKLPQHICIILP